MQQTYLCHECSKNYCFDHLSEHHRNHSQQRFDQLRKDCDELQRQINELKTNSKKDLLFKEIVDFETESIDHIKRHTQLCKKVIQDSNELVQKFELRFNDLTQNLQDDCPESEFNDLQSTYSDNTSIHSPIYIGKLFFSCSLVLVMLLFCHSSFRHSMEKSCNYHCWW